MRLSKMKIAAATLIGALSSTSAYAGAPVDWQTGFQEGVTQVMREINDLHNVLLVVITLISVFVLGLLLYTMWRFSAKRNPVPSKTTHNTLIEVVWTVVPVIILAVLLFPSLKLLYLSDTIPKADMTIKATGHQWYWSYAYPDHGNIEFDANVVDIQNPDMSKEDRMAAEKKFGANYKRLLDTDTEIVVPVNKTVRVQVTASDVLHAWAVPAFGVKIDAIPGRLNETWFKAEKTGVYYGQCSELCGSRHGFMPIKVRVVSEDDFKKWVGTQVSSREPAATARRVAGLTGKTAE